MGFCLGKGKAISNNPKLGAPAIHPLSYRPVIGYFWHKKLD
jgi:hypothetical protein